MVIVSIYQVLNLDGEVMGLYPSKDKAFESVPDLSAQSPYNDAYWMMLDSDQKHKVDIELFLLPQLHLYDWDSDD